MLPGPVREPPSLPSSLLPALRNALRGALATGIAGDDVILARAQTILKQQDVREEAARAELVKALALARGLPQMRNDDSSMMALKERLSAVLAVCRSLGLAEADLRETENKRRRVHNMMQDLKGQIRVFCRVRPLSQKESSQQDIKAIHDVDDMSLEVPNAGSFAYDGVFNPGSQEEVFEDCRDLVQSAVDGHNVTIFAYGQTGAGKTYTMFGVKGDKELEGIAPRAIMELFQIIDIIRPCHDIVVMGSMVELYNNHLVDLLRIVPRRGSMGAISPKLSLRQDRAGNMQVLEMKEQEVKDAGQLKALLDRGIAQRTVAANAMNIESSRSHLIFTIRVSSVNHETKETVKGKILLCDLGGSERLKKTEATGDRKTEAIEINKSLTALGDVIEAVAKKQKQVPYRNHKLTQIMQDSLGGTAKTLLFVNCSPALSSLDETTMSLKYAARVKKITNLARTPSHSPPRSRSAWESPQASPHQSPIRTRPSRSELKDVGSSLGRSAPGSRSSSVSRRGSAGIHRRQHSDGNFMEFSRQTSSAETIPHSEQAVEAKCNKPSTV